MTHVKIENLSFSKFNNDIIHRRLSRKSVIIYTEGLVTLSGCTIHYFTWFFMYKSQYEPVFTYKTAEMISSVISNKTINIINTNVHHILQLHLLSGIRTVNIIRSDFILSFLEVVLGNKSVDMASSHHLTVLNISIINTTLTYYATHYMAYERDSIISMKTTHSTFNNSYIGQVKGAGYFGAVFEDTKFYRSRVLFRQVTSVSMRNCEYEVSDNISMDNVKISGNDHFYYKPEGIKQTVKLLICDSFQCEGYWSTVSIESTVFTGTLNKQTDSVIKTEQVIFIMSNVTFDIHQKGVNRKRWYISYTSRSKGMLTKLNNVTINATSMPSAASFVMVSSRHSYLENLEIFCPRGLAVVNVSSQREEQFSCEKQCPIDGCTFEAGSAVINGNKPYNNIKYS